VPTGRAGVPVISAYRRVVQRKAFLSTVTPGDPSKGSEGEEERRGGEREGRQGGRE